MTEEIIRKLEEVQTAIKEEQGKLKIGEVAYKPKWLQLQVAMDRTRLALNALRLYSSWIAY